jgi:hypothetical protein
LKTDWPWAETRTDWIFMGYDEDLNQAMKIAVEQTVQWLATQRIVPMSREEAYALTSMVRLPRDAGGRHPQGRALHDSQAGFCRIPRGWDHQPTACPSFLKSEPPR